MKWMIVAVLLGLQVFGVDQTAAQPGPGKPTLAFQPCGERSMMISMMERYNETAHAGGVVGGHGLVELWLNTDTSSFTVSFTRSDGQMCILAGGKSWEQFKSFAKGLEH